MTPQRASSWIATVLPVLERGGPVVALLTLIVGSLTIWYLLGVLDRAVTRNHVLVDKIIALQESHRQEVVRLAHCPPP